MQPMSSELMSSIASRLKCGEFDKPVCYVEVDKMAFVAGRTEKFAFVVNNVTPGTTDNTYINSSGSTALSYGGFVFPVAGRSVADINSKFHEKRGSRLHQGVDIPANRDFSSDVFAAMAGTVMNVNNDTSQASGRSVNIRHANGVVTKYFHLHSISVSKGAVVSAGQVIGKAGNTGHCVTQGVNLFNNNSAQATSLRNAGYGTHLHFEVWEGVPENVTALSVANMPKCGKTVDPENYMKGSTKLITGVTNTGDVVNQGTTTGYETKTVAFENFARREWYNASKYTLHTGFKDHTTLGKVLKSDSYNWLKFSFKGIATPLKGTSTGASTSTGFTMSLGHAINGGTLSFRARSNFVKADGDYVQITAKLSNGSTMVIAKLDDMPSKYAEQYMPNFSVPKDTVSIDFTVHWGGKLANLPAGSVLSALADPKKFSISVISVKERVATAPQQSITSANTPVNVPSIVEVGMSETTYTDIEVGEFCYSETLRLDNVQSCIVNSALEQECSGLTVTITNPDSFYSPDYDPSKFPELYRKPSPWSDFMNGMRVGVIGENTPVRVYMGYGMNTLRVFTGLIDKVDVVGEAGILTIAARDMYKKISNTVLREDKKYPDTGSHSDITVSNAVGELNDARRQEIIDAAYKHSMTFGVDYLFMLAICGHETAYGTLGRGRPESGSMIVGYGVFASNKEDYYGIDAQMYYCGKRVAEALASRGKTVRSKADVAYFNSGGDKGSSYPWSGVNEVDGWNTGVWNLYNSIKAAPANWKPSANAGASTPATGTDGVPTESSGTMWLKTAIVHDLVTYAGMLGWRAKSDDLSYPDVFVEESYLIEANPKSGYVIKAVAGEEGKFVQEPIQSVYSNEGWMNPFVSDYIEFPAFSFKVGDAISEVIKDTNYRSYCDRYGTYRLEQLNLNKPIRATFTDLDNIISISKTINFANARSHLRVVDELNSEAHFIDKEILMELKGELRTASVQVPWAKTYEQKREVAKRLFSDMKHLARTLQVAVVGNPAIDILDRVVVADKSTATRETYLVKGNTVNFSSSTGFVNLLELTWSREGVII